MARAGHDTRAPSLRLPKLELPRNRLPFIPQNEAGVAVLFGMFAANLGFKLTAAQYRFPDCAAMLGRRKIHIELEYRSRSFQTHVKKKQWPKERCDLIICWEHDWPGVPERLPVLEMRKMFGLGWSVWLVPMHAEFADYLPMGKALAEGWSVPSRSGPDDLLLIYRPGTEREVREVMRVRSPVEKVRAGWRKGNDWMASIQRVATLERPITLDDLTRIGVDRHSLQGRPGINHLWSSIRTLIVRRNPGLRTTLASYGPSRGNRPRA